MLRRFERFSSDKTIRPVPKTEVFTAMQKYWQQKALTRKAEINRDMWKQRAYTDELTGLLDRRGFEHEAKQLVESHANSGNLVLVVFDLDRLKLLNDKYKHSSGDRGILAFTSFLDNNLREDDMVARNIKARYGGDEFLALLDITPRQGSENLSKTSRAERLIGRLTTSFDRDVVQHDSEFSDVGFGVSAGAILYDPKLTIPEWIDQADALMYQQKQLRAEQSH